MNRGDYIETQEGQKILLLKRRFKRLYFQIVQEPKSKNSVSKEEKIYFQQQILHAMQKFKRRAYRSPIIMEVDFWCNRNNPPDIHTLAKNYLDLLSVPLKSSKIKRKRLLYEDDRYIKILIVNYILSPKLPSQISIKIDLLGNFFEDVKLLERIIHNDFKGDDGSYNSFDVNEFEKEGDNSFSDPYQKLEDLRENKDLYKKIIGQDTYRIMEDYAIEDIQKDYLQIGHLSASVLISLFAPLIKKQTPSNTLQEILKIMEYSRNMIISPPFTLDLRHTPIRKGQKVLFKNNVNTVLKDLKKRFPILSPLKTPLGVVVLYVAPKIQSIDLDNLARYIIPFVNETIQPPVRFVNNTNSITRYQFIELPRYGSEPKNGYVRLIFDNPSFESIWSKVDKIIDKWEDK